MLVDFVLATYCFVMNQNLVAKMTTYVADKSVP